MVTADSKTNHPQWQEEFHVYGMVTDEEDHDHDTDPSDCSACQKEIYNRPKYAVKGWDYDCEPIPLERLFEERKE